MAWHMLVIVLLLSVAGLAGGLVYAMRTAARKLSEYAAALGEAQRRMDHQTSRLNILSRAFPNLQSVLSTPQSADNWPITVLDDARALVSADSAAYWRYNEEERELELQANRGLDPGMKEARLRLDRDKGLVVDAAAKRLPALAVSDEIVSERQSALAVPIIVGGRLWGVFRLARKGDDPMSARDLDLISMFIRQVALALEYRDLVNNREKFYLQLVQTLADIVDARDAANQGQSKTARRIARGIARELDLPDDFIYYLEFAALMHDIGKIGIDESLLRKPGRLTPQEFETIKRHPELGYKILEPVTMLAPVAPMVLYHQEWYNGGGYPEGLSGEEIPLGARIVAVIDAWCSMTSVRPWRAALTREQAIGEIRKGSGTQFDPRVVDAFLSSLEKQGVSDAGESAA